jgi:hypothetical protein
MKQIKVLSDNRSDVVKLLGSPVDNDRENYLWYYDFKEGRMSILYSIGVCKTVTQNGLQAIHGWKVPEWTVVEIGFSLEEPVDPKELNINFEGYSSSTVHDAPEWIEYANEKLGIYYTTLEGKIQGITYRGTKNNFHLKCKETDVN